MLDVIQPPLSLLTERNTVIDRFYSLEMFLGVSPARGNDFPSLSQPFGFR